MTGCGSVCQTMVPCVPLIVCPEMVYHQKDFDDRYAGSESFVRVYRSSASGSQSGEGANQTGSPVVGSDMPIDEVRPFGTSRC